MEYTLPRSEIELVDLFKFIAKTEFAWDCDVPIIINSRLYTTLGSYVFDLEDHRIPIVTGFEFHKNIINGKLPLYEVVNTIKHELVHWYTNLHEKKSCDHNEAFLKNCEKFGVTGIEKYRQRNRLRKDEYYEVMCCGCDRVVAKCKNMGNLKLFMKRYIGGTKCSCGAGKRYIIDKGIKYVYYHGKTGYGDEFWNETEYITKTLKIILCKEKGLSN